MRGWFLIEFNNLVASTEHLNCCWLLASPKVQFDYAMLLQRDAPADEEEVEWEWDAGRAS